MFNADNLKNWAILGNLMTIMISDVIQIFLSTKENLKISLGIVEALMTYSNFFSKSYRTIELNEINTKTIFDTHQNVIQYQWAQIFGQISKLSPVTFENCLGFVHQALREDHKMIQTCEINDLAEMIYHSRFLNVQPALITQNDKLNPQFQLQIQQQKIANVKKTNQVITLLSDMIQLLNSPKIDDNFKIVLLKTLRHFIAQLNFRDEEILQESQELRDIWQNAVVQNVFQFVDKTIISKMFPDVGQINLHKIVGPNHWDHLLESSFNQHVILLIIQIIKVSEQSFYNDTLVRLMNWLCLPQMLENKKSFEFANRILLELYTPELYKQSEFLHWQPKLINHIHFLQDTNHDFCTPLVSHTDQQILNQMPHRSPAILNAKNQLYIYSISQMGQNLHSKFGISFQETYPLIFSRKNMEYFSKSGKQYKSVTFQHRQFLDLMSIYDLQFLQQRVIPDFILEIDNESLLSQEKVLLGLEIAHKLIDPSQNFRQKYILIHEQICEKSQDNEMIYAQTKILDECLSKLKQLIEQALILIIQSPIWNGKYAQDTTDFFKSSQYKELCQDKMGVIWPSQSLSLMKESEFVSKFLKNNGFAQNLIQINKSSVTFEDHVEIISHHYENRGQNDPFNLNADARQRLDENFLDGHNDEELNGRYEDFFITPKNQIDDSKKENFHNQNSYQKMPQYIDEDLNKITKSLSKDLGQSWDKKREKFIRHKLVAYLQQDRKSDSNKNIHKDSWQNDCQQIKSKQKSLIYSENQCLKRQTQIDIKVLILKMMSYLQNILKTKPMSQNLCKDIMLSKESYELTDQIVSGLNQKHKMNENSPIDFDKYDNDSIGKSFLDLLHQKVQDMNEKYSEELNFRKNKGSNDEDLDKMIEDQVLGGTQRLAKQKGRNYNRLRNVEQNVIAYGILSVDYRVCSKTSKLVQKMFISGSLEVKIFLIDQIVYMIKELMIDSHEDYHLPMLIQLLVSSIKIWHHSEIHKLRITQQTIGAHLRGIQFNIINSTKKVKKGQSQSYPQINQYLYIFDLIDSITLLGICNNQKICRNLSICLLQESSKLKRLICGSDTRKSLADLLYMHEFAIKEKIVDRMILLKMFKFKNQKNEGKVDTFTKTYCREDIENFIMNLGFFKIIEDSFDYKKAKINESLARDIAVQYVGEITTLWKNEFKSLMPGKEQSQEDSLFKKMKKTHRIVGQKLINFIFNISKRTLYVCERKIDQYKFETGERADQPKGKQYSGPAVTCKSRQAYELNGPISQEKNFTSSNIHLALILYSVTISSYNQVFSEQNEQDQIENQSSKSKLENDEVIAEFDEQYLEYQALKNKKMAQEKSIQKQKSLQRRSKISSFQQNIYNLLTLMSLDPIDFFKCPTGSGITPSKIPVSSTLISIQYLIQNPLSLSNNSNESQLQDALENQFKTLMDIFGYHLLDNTDEQYLKNCVLFWCLLFVSTDSSDGESLQSELSYLIKNQESAQNLCFCETLLTIVQVAQRFLSDPRQNVALDVIKCILYNGLAKIIKIILENNPTELKKAHESENFLPLGNLQKILNFCEQNCLQASQDWLIHKNRQSYYFFLQYFNFIAQDGQNQKIQLDLQHLINLQNLGYDVLKYFKLEQNGYQKKVGMSSKDQMAQGVNEFKTLINSVYQFYGPQEDIDQLKVSVNPFYECFLSQIVPNDREQEKNFLEYLQDNRFAKAYEKMTNATFNFKFDKGKEQSILIDKQVRKFVQYKVHSKIFLLTLSMALTLKSTGYQEDQISQIERSRLICLATLPLMFEDEEIKEQIEQLISEEQRLEELIKYDNRDFYRLIKRMIKYEETYNEQHNFEKYFAINGFIRNLLNEIIKLQTQNELKIYASSIMLIKVLDTLTYFMSSKDGIGIKLRRAPVTSDKTPFIFENLIDYKSFEFLSKLFKITEKLIEYDQQMIIMNMWFKLVEDQSSNQEILSKFLIHNLGSTMIKLKQQALKQTGQKENELEKNQTEFIKICDEGQYSIPFQKTKRYSINIFNFIKARLQRIDIRNSLQFSKDTPCWSHQMINVLMHASLNIQSKYVLEKVKLKKILQTMHREINQTGIALKLNGGVNTETFLSQIVSQAQDQDGSNANAQIFQSVRISQLLESKTFLKAFSQSNRQETHILQNLLFNFQRIIKEKFAKVTPASQVNQFDEILIKYFENSLVFIANDTDRDLQSYNFNKEQELVIVVVILILIGNLIMNHSEQRYKYLIDLFKAIQANILSSNYQTYFHLNTLSPRQLSINERKGGKSSQFSVKILAMFNYKSTLFECFDQFTRIYFQLIANFSANSHLRLNMIDLYQQIFRGLREVQRQKLNNQDKDLQQFDASNQSVMNSPPQILQTSKKLRLTILAMIKSAFFNIHELATTQSKQNLQASQTGSQSQQQQFELNQIYGLCKNFRQHISNIIEYILYFYELDQLKKDLAKSKDQRKNSSAIMSSNNDILASDLPAASRQILFACNTLFWIGITCLEAPQHYLNQFDSSENSNKSTSQKPILFQMQQIQNIGIIAIRRTLEDTNFLKILYVYHNLSDLFYSYNLQMASGKTSVMNVLMNSIRNPLCTRDALKMLIVTVRIQDQKLLVGANQITLDNKAQDSEMFVGRLELVRLLYLLAYFMQQFTDPSENDIQIFNNKKNMIQLLKKSLPSIGINKKSEIINLLEDIQRKTACVEFEDNIENQIKEKKDLSQSFEKLIIQTINLLDNQALQESLQDCCQTLKILKLNQDTKYAAPRENENDSPIKSKVLQIIIGHIQNIIPKDNEVNLIESINEKHIKGSIFNINQEILGEEVDNYKHEFKALYFGFKNILTKEIEFMEQDIDINQFFDRETQSNQQTLNSQNLNRGSYHQHKQRSSNQNVPIASNMASQQRNLLKQSSQLLINQQEAAVSRKNVIKSQSKNIQQSIQSQQIVAEMGSVQQSQQKIEESKYTQSPSKVRDDYSQYDNKQQFKQSQVATTDNEDHKRKSINQIEQNEEIKKQASLLSNKKSQRQKSMTRYENNQEQDFEDDNLKMSIQGAPKLQSFQINQSSNLMSQSKPLDQIQSNTTQIQINSQHQSKQSFADLAQIQLQNQNQSIQVKNAEIISDHVPFNAFNAQNQSNQIEEQQEQDTGMMTFDKYKTQKIDKEKVLQFDKAEGIVNYQNQSQQSQRNFNQPKNINFYPEVKQQIDNESSYSLNEAIKIEKTRARPQTSNIQNQQISQNSDIDEKQISYLIQKQLEQHERQRNQISYNEAHQKNLMAQQQHLKNQSMAGQKQFGKTQKLQAPPAALQPNFVAEQSNKIWSDVASQKSQLQAQLQASQVSKQTVDKRDFYVNQNNQLVNQINARSQLGDFSDFDRQSEQSKYSFTQASKNKKYQNDDVNFDFSQGGMD